MTDTTLAPNAHSSLPAARSFAVTGSITTPAASAFVSGIADRLTAAGYACDDPRGDTAIILHPVDIESPRPYRRKSAPTFVIAVAEVPAPPVDPLRAGYPLLVRCLANLTVLVATTHDGLVIDFITLEQGTYRVGPAQSEVEVLDEAYARIDPLASSQLVIANRFVADLPPELRNGDASTLEMLAAGRALDALDLLPAPFPLEEILPPRDLRHVKLLFGIGGLSYGNLSARYSGASLPPIDGVDGPDFWMSASGVDKTDLRDIGTDILLVRGYDRGRRLADQGTPNQGMMVLSVPPAITPRRVSVDAIEHWMIYREHPSVGAIVHVHGWIDGTPSTEVNYPCGTIQLASAVAELVRGQPDPGRAIVGLRNHGLTITGSSLEEIFDRVGDRILPRVPMS